VRNWAKTGATLLCATMIFAGCGNQGANEGNNVRNAANGDGANNYYGVNTDNNLGTTGFGGRSITNGGVTDGRTTGLETDNADWNRITRYGTDRNLRSADNRNNNDTGFRINNENNNRNNTYARYGNNNGNRGTGNLTNNNNGNNNNGFSALNDPIYGLYDDGGSYRGFEGLNELNLHNRSIFGNNKNGNGISYGNNNNNNNNNNNGNAYGIGNGNGTTTFNTRNLGISTALEARLLNEDIRGVKVLVLDDTIILGHTRNQTQNLSMNDIETNDKKGNNNNNKGNNNKNTNNNNNADANNRTGNVNNDNSKILNTNYGQDLMRARTLIQTMFGQNFNIVTVQDEQGVKALTRIKESLSTNGSTKNIGQHLSTLMKNLNGSIDNK
jgi:hypothetical protein